MAMKEKLVKVCYENIKKALDKREWTYTQNEEKLLIKFSVYGEDLSSNYYFSISTEKETVTLTAYLPYRTPRNDTNALAQAIAVANSRFYNGVFEFNPKNREVSFRVSTFLLDGMEMSVDAVDYMIDVACDMVDKYDDKLFAVAKGYLSLEKYIEIITGK